MLGLCTIDLRAVAMHSVFACSSRGAGSTNGPVSQTMGTVAIQTQCCLKQDESDDDDDNAPQSSAEMLVSAVRDCKPLVGLSGACNAPYATKAPSEASTIFVP